MLTKNNRTEFFKYLSPEAAKAVLANGTLRWSTPALLNDPFDNQLNILLHPDIDQMAQEQHELFIAMIHGDKPVEFYDPFQTTVIEMLRREIRGGRVTLTTEELDELKQGAYEGVQRIAELMPETNTEIKARLADTALFCMTEDCRNNLMWSHYAGQHTGAVLKFTPTYDDSFLTIAQPVVYMDQPRRFTAKEFMDYKSLPYTIMHYINFTKSTAWGYEKEWRVASGLRNPSNEYEDIPFIKDELSEVYLGCRISASDKDTIIHLVKDKFPQAKLYQSSMSPDGFDLMFNPIHC